MKFLQCKSASRLRAFYMLLFFITVAVFGFAGPVTTIASTKSGSWSDPTTWVGGSVPSTTFNVIIATGHTITLTANTSISGSITVEAGATLALSTFTLSSPSGVQLYCGATTGSVISGSGLLTLGGNVTVTNAGTGTDGALINCPVELTNSTNRTFDVADDGTAAADLTIAGIIESSGKLIKAGAGALHFTAANTFSGGTTLNSGTLMFGIGTAGSITSGPVGTGTFTLNGGNIQASTVGIIIDNPMIWSGSFSFGSTGPGGNIKMEMNGAVTVSADVTVTIPNEAVNGSVFGGNIDADDVSNNRILTFSGTGLEGAANDLVLNGNVGTTNAFKSIIINNKLHKLVLNGSLQVNGATGGEINLVCDQLMQINNHINSSNSNITLTNLGRGLNIIGISIGAFNIEAGTGNISITGVGGTSSGSGVSLAGSNLQTTTGTITLSGSANPANTSGGGHGISITGGAKVQSSDGNITITGNGSSGTNAQRGITMGDADTRITSVNGNISLTGTSASTGTGTAINQHGIFINSPASISTSGTGHITLEGRRISGTSGISISMASGSSLNTGTGNITLITTSGDDAVINATLGGNGKLIKQGTLGATLGVMNYYSGATQIEAGTILVGNTNALPATAVTVSTGATLNLQGRSITIGSLAGNGTVVAAKTGVAVGTTLLSCGEDNTSTEFSGILDDGTMTLGLLKKGSGTFTLSGNNTYSGGTNLTAGQLNINHAHALGTTTGTFTIDGGNIDNTSGADITLIDYPLALNSNFTYQGSGPHSLNMGNGAISINDSRSITVTAGTLTLGGELLEDTKNLTKLGAGTLHFGSNAKALNDLNISAGTLTGTSGALMLKGHFTNNGSYSHNSGSVSFSGSTAQQISGSTATTFHHLILNNAAGLSLAGSVGATVAGTLTLTDGRFTLNGNHLMVGSFSGGSASSYVETPVLGLLKTQIAHGSSVKLPVGNSAYNPVEIDNQTGTADSFYIRVMDEVYQDGDDGIAYQLPRIKRTWDIHKKSGSANAGSGINYVFYWNAPGEVVSVNTPTLFHYEGAWVQPATGTNASFTTNTLTYTGYKGSFSFFAIGDLTVPLPMVLKQFTAQPKGQAVALNWQTASEQNTRKFVVEHSTDGRNWTAIGQVAAAGNSAAARSYAFTHFTAAAGIQYYRLQLLDLDGHYSYSQVIQASLTRAGATMAIYPNPASQGILQVQLAEPAVVKLYNSSGSLLLSRACQAGTQQLNIAGIPAGVYLITAGNQTERLVIQ